MSAVGFLSFIPPKSAVNDNGDSAGVSSAVPSNSTADDKDFHEINSLGNDGSDISADSTTDEDADLSATNNLSDISTHSSPRWRSFHLGRNCVCQEDGSIGNIYLSGSDKVKLTSSSFPSQLPACAGVNKEQDAFPVNLLESFITSCAELRDLDLSGASLHWNPRNCEIFEAAIAKAGENRLISVTLPRGYEPTPHGLKALFRVSPKLEKLSIFIPATNVRHWRASVPGWIKCICQIADGSLLKNLVLDIEMCHEPISRSPVDLHVSSTKIVFQLANLDIEYVLLNYPTLQTLRVKAVYSDKLLTLRREKKWHSPKDELANKPTDQLWKNTASDAAFFMPRCLRSLELGFISLHIPFEDDDSEDGDSEDGDSEDGDSEDDGSEDGGSEDGGSEHDDLEDDLEESELSRLFKFLDQHYKGLESLSLTPAYGNEENGIDHTNLYNMTPKFLSATLLSQPSWWQKINSIFLELVTTKDWVAFKAILPRMTHLKNLYLNLFFDHVREALNLDGIIKQKLDSLTILVTSLYSVDRIPEVMQLWDQVVHLSMFSCELAYVSEFCLGDVLSQIPSTWQLQSVSITGYHCPLESHSLIKSAFTSLRNITSLIVWSCLLEKIEFERLVPLMPLIEVFKAIEFRDGDLFGPRFSAECIRSGSYEYWESDLPALLGWKRLRECIFSLRLSESEMPDPESIELSITEDSDEYSSYFYDYPNFYARYLDPITYLKNFAKLSDDEDCVRRNSDESDDYYETSSEMKRNDDQERWDMLPRFSSQCKRELTRLERLQIYGFNDDVDFPRHYAPLFIALKCGMGELHCFFR